MHSRVLPRVAVALVVMLVVSAAGCTELLGRAKNARTGPGDNALDFLTDAKYSKLIVEIDSVVGSEPDPAALTRLEQALETYLDKPGGVTVDASGRVPGNSRSTKYSFTEIDRIEKEHREHYSSGDTAALYILYIDGGSTQDEGNRMVLGAVYHGSSMVMFKGNLRTMTEGGSLLFPRPPIHCVERAVIVHELGHVLGLVNHPLPMVRPHEDPESEGHSSNKGSVMYKAVEDSQALLNLFGDKCDSIPHEFDGDDKADMKAAGGK